MRSGKKTKAGKPKNPPLPSGLAEFDEVSIFQIKCTENKQEKGN